MKFLSAIIAFIALSSSNAEDCCETTPGNCPGEFPNQAVDHFDASKGGAYAICCTQGASPGLGVNYSACTGSGGGQSVTHTTQTTSTSTEDCCESTPGNCPGEFPVQAVDHFKMGQPYAICCVETASGVNYGGVPMCAGSESQSAAQVHATSTGTTVQGVTQGADDCCETPSATQQTRSGSSSVCPPAMYEIPAAQYSKGSTSYQVCCDKDGQASEVAAGGLPLCSDHVAEQDVVNMSEVTVTSASTQTQSTNQCCEHPQSEECPAQAPHDFRGALYEKGGTMYQVCCVADGNISEMNLGGITACSASSQGAASTSSVTVASSAPAGQTANQCCEQPAKQACPAGAPHDIDGAIYSKGLAAFQVCCVAEGNISELNVGGLPTCSGTATTTSSATVASTSAQGQPANSCCEHPAAQECPASLKDIDGALYNKGATAYQVCCVADGNVAEMNLGGIPACNSGAQPTTQAASACCETPQSTNCPSNHDDIEGAIYNKGPTVYQVCCPVDGNADEANLGGIPVCTGTSTVTTPPKSDASTRTVAIGAILAFAALQVAM